MSAEWWIIPWWKSLGWRWVRCSCQSAMLTPLAIPEEVLQILIMGYHTVAKLFVIGVMLGDWWKVEYERYCFWYTSSYWWKKLHCDIFAIIPPESRVIWYYLILLGAAWHQIPRSIAMEPSVWWIPTLTSPHHHDPWTWTKPWQLGGFTNDNLHRWDLVHNLVPAWVVSHQRQNLRV